jgi:peptidoglycan hydrolase-like protein with peptidoglycan-binding domain
MLKSLLLFFAFCILCIALTTPANSFALVIPSNHQLWDRGEDIKAPQQWLNANGYPLANDGYGAPGQETSLFGPRTYAALNAFQTANGLPATGYLGDLSRAVLASLAPATASGAATTTPQKLSGIFPLASPLTATSTPASSTASTTSRYLPGVTPLPGYQPGQLIFIGGGSSTPAPTLPAPATYIAKAVHFDGSTWLSSNSDLGMVNGRKGIVSFWVKETAYGAFAGPNFESLILSNNGTFLAGGCMPQGGGGNGAGIILANDAAEDFNENLDTPQGAVLCPPGIWHHFLFSWNTDFANPAQPGGGGNGRLVAVYIDGVQTNWSYAVPGVGPAFDIDYLDLPLFIGGGGVFDGDFGVTGDVADLYVNTKESIVRSDNTISEADELKFGTADNKPVYLGSNGSFPTGNTPTVFLTGDASQWPANAAGTGSFTVASGSLTDASTSPSD